MNDFDSLIAELTGGSAIKGQLVAADRMRRRLELLHGRIDASLPGLVPRAAGGWRSTAADRYAERLIDLQSLLAEVRAAVEAAEQQLALRIEQLRAQLDDIADAQRIRVTSGDEVASWTAR